MPTALRWLLRLGPTNPVCVRLVQGGSKRKRHLYLRSAYLALLIIVLLWTLLMTSQSGALSYRALAAAGATSFKYVAYLQVGLICLIAPLFMAGAIAQEANPKTWDILLTTPLTAAQIVLGNLFGRLFFILALLAASLPLFAVTQYFGGVPSRSIFLSYAIAAGAAVGVGAVAIALCVSRVAGQRAVFVFYISVVTYLAVTSAIDAVIAPAGQTSALTPVNPFLTLRSILSPSGYAPHTPDQLAGASLLARAWFGSPALSFLLVTFVGSFVIVTLSVWNVRSATLHGLRLTKNTSDDDVSESGRAGRVVGRNPIAWREAESRGGFVRQMARWGFLAAGLLWALGFLAFFHAGALDAAAFRFTLLSTLWTEYLVITLVAVVSASSTIASEREDGTLDILLTTPITPADYLGGKLKGLVRYLGPMLAAPIITTALAAGYVALGGLGGAAELTESLVVSTTTVEVPVILPVAALVAPLTSVPFVAFCAVVGLQWSLKSKGVVGATVGAFGVVLAAGGVLGMCGFNAGNSLPYVGPSLACLTPVTAVSACVTPASSLVESLDRSGSVDTLTLPLLVGALVVCVVYVCMTWAVKISLIKSFDVTMRKLAGAR